jgi:hypothetical protein
VFEVFVSEKKKGNVAALQQTVNARSTKTLAHVFGIPTGIEQDAGDAAVKGFDFNQRATTGSIIGIKVNPSLAGFRSAIGCHLCPQARCVPPADFGDSLDFDRPAGTDIDGGACRDGERLALLDHVSSYSVQLLNIGRCLA